MRHLIAILALFIAASGFSEGTLSPESLLPSFDGGGGTGVPPVTLDAFAPALAWGGGVYLLAWQAGRNEKADIVGLRLDKAGKPLDLKPLTICGAKDTQERPRVAFSGGVFLVAWHDLRNAKDWDVYAARVTPEGTLADPDGIAVADAERNQCEPGLCWDGKAFQVLWRGFQGEREDAVDVGRRPEPQLRRGQAPRTPPLARVGRHPLHLCLGRAPEGQGVPLRGPVLPLLRPRRLASRR